MVRAKVQCVPLETHLLKKTTKKIKDTSNIFRMSRREITVNQKCTINDSASSQCTSKLRKHTFINSLYIFAFILLFLLIFFSELLFFLLSLPGTWTYYRLMFSQQCSSLTADWLFTWTLSLTPLPYPYLTHHHTRHLPNWRDWCSILLTCKQLETP